MEHQDRLETLAATIDQLPMLVAVATGDEQRLITVNAAGRAVIGDHALDTPSSEWADDLGHQLGQRYREAWRTGEASSDAGWTLTPVRGPDGGVRAVVGVRRDLPTPVGDRRTEVVERRHLAANDVLVQLQDTILPKGLPVPQRVGLAARYLLAEEYADAGGDWFDAIPVVDGRLVVVVGDVVGHGVEAAVVMGELKAVFAERVRQDGDVVAALELLDARARRGEGARTTTLCAVVLDPVSGELTYCTAGHPPPLVVSADGTASYLPVSGAGPLAGGRPFTTARHRLAPGDLLLLYSDGIVERPGRTPAQGTVELLRVAGGRSGDQTPERLCRESLEQLTRGTGYTDDITLLALQVLPPVAPLELRLPAIPDVVRTVRFDLGDWLAALGISAFDASALQHAVGELVSNAVAHAYPSVDVRNEVRVSVGLSPDGVVEIEVSDDGRWRSSTPGDSGGRGLTIAGGLLDEIDVATGDGGTRVLGRHRVTRPVALLRGTSTAPPGSGPAAFGLQVDDDLVRVEGAVDARAADGLRSALSRSSRGGTQPITVDLGGVELLCSAAVQVLFDTCAAGPVELLAPTGSVAHQVLELVQLPSFG